MARRRASQLHVSLCGTDGEAVLAGDDGVQVLGLGLVPSRPRLVSIANATRPCSSAPEKDT
jgi:hypothetical protein